MTRSRLAAARLRCDRLSAPAALSAAAQRYELAPAERARRARAAGHLCAPASRRASPHQHASKHVCKHAQSDPHSLAANVLVMTVWCCCPVELSGRRPQVRQQPPARSDPQQARAIRPARKLALWAGTPVRARVGLTGRNRTRRTPAPRVVCVSLIRSFDPTLPSLGHNNSSRISRSIACSPSGTKYGQPSRVKHSSTWNVCRQRSAKMN